MIGDGEPTSGFEKPVFNCPFLSYRRIDVFIGNYLNFLVEKEKRRRRPFKVGLLHTAGEKERLIRECNSLA